MGQPVNVEPGEVESQQAARETLPTELDLEALGRRRPDIFSTIWTELGFCFSLLTSMMMAVSVHRKPCRDDANS
jgi:hypothetical protein